MRPRRVEAVALAMMVLAVPTGRAADVPAATPSVTSAVPASLPAELGEKLDFALDCAAPIRRAMVEKRLDAVVAAIQATVHRTHPPLSVPHSAAVRVAVDRSIAEWREGTRARMLEDFRRAPELTAARIEALTHAPDELASPRVGDLHFTAPEEQPEWTASLAKVLTPAELATWQGKFAEYKLANEEIAKLLDDQVDHQRAVYRSAVGAEVERMQTELALPEDRADKLLDLGYAAAEQGLRAYREYLTQHLRAMSNEQRQKTLASGGLHRDPRPIDAPGQQDVWLIGLEKLLSASEIRQLASAADERDKLRVRALGQMLLAVMDERTALTGNQRDRLMAAAEAAVPKAHSLNVNAESHSFVQFSREAFFEAAGLMQKEAVQSVLDREQWQAWREACASQEQRLPGLPASQEVAAQARSKPPEPPLDIATAEPEEIESYVSRVLEEKATEEQRRLLRAALLKTEDVVRVARPAPEVIARLKSAARGATEQTLVTWKAVMSQNVRAQLATGDPESVRVVLANLPGMQFTGDDEASAPEPASIWEKSVARELTAGQRKVWQEEVDARSASLDEAAVGLILAEFDRRFQINGQMWRQLEPLLRTVLRDYDREIAEGFSKSAGANPWYFQGYLMFLPIVGIPPDDLKRIVGNGIWSHWAASPEHANAASFWRNIEQAHAENLKGNDSE